MSWASRTSETSTELTSAEPAEGGETLASPPSALGLVNPETSDAWNPHDPECQRKRRLGRMRRCIISAAECIQRDLDALPVRYRPIMITPTYRPGVSWEPRHLSRLVQRIREHLKRKGLVMRYVWVAELQRNGRVHWHLVLWLPWNTRLPKPDSQGWWPHGMTRIELARRPIGYLLKYASKGTPGLSFPRGLRLSGRGGLGAESRRAVRWAALPRYVREAFTQLLGEYLPSVNAYPCPGGGYVCRETGVWVQSWQKPKPETP
jgi:hypothetical protein